MLITTILNIMKFSVDAYAIARGRLGITEKIIGQFINLSLWNLNGSTL
jgi:hypothetical protein